MATKEWMEASFADGYDSGDILSPVPSSLRLRQEVLIGGSYREAFFRAILPFLKPDSVVLELGPGRGSWSRAILQHIPEGRLETVDYVDATAWLQPERYNGRLTCHQVQDHSLACVPDGTFDFFWSFGVLCHHSIEQIQEILRNARPKMKRGGVSVHEYGEWNKFYESGRMVAFPDLLTKPDTECFWPSNSTAAMSAAATAAGWLVIEADMDLFTRDGIILLKAW